MSRYKNVYESKADIYESLVSKEDYRGNLLPAIQRIYPVDQKDIAEFGAGTGRLTRLLAPRAKFIRAFDAYPVMLEMGRTCLTRLGIENVLFALGENKALPVESKSADLTIAGWTFGHCISWFPETWKKEIISAVQEMIRITRPAGAAIILETLGTGSESPIEPTPGLSEYYAFLENEFGFERSWIRTDYRFESREQANSLTQSFFGKSYSLEIGPDGRAILPECTGIWHRLF